MTVRQRQLLTVGHSYVLRSRRRLAEAIQTASNGMWRVTVAAPSYYHGNPRFGDLAPEQLRVGSDEAVDVIGIPVYFSSRIHVALYHPRLRALMGSGFDAIHCWEEPYILAGGQLALWAPRECVLTYRSAQNLNKRYPPPFNLVERYAIARADGWIAAGTLVERNLAARALYPDVPHRVIGHGIDTGLYRPDPVARNRARAILGWMEPEPIVFGYLGRFTVAKGVRMLMRVLDVLSMPWRALFIGSGELEPELRAWAAVHEGRARVMDYVPYDSVPAYLNAIDILCVPSQSTPAWREQFGRVLIEALACGVPVVASDSGEIPLVVGDAGKIVAEQDERAWIDALSELAAKPALREHLSLRGLRRVSECYTWPMIGEKYVTFFDMLVTMRQSRASRERDRIRIPTRR